MYLKRVTGALRRAGHTPIVLAFGAREKHYMEDGVEVFFVHCPEIRSRFAGVELVCNIIYRDITLNRKVAALIAERDIDIIQFASIWGSAFCYHGRVPAVMRMSTYTKVYREYRKDKFEVDLQAFLERLAARRCNAVFAPSDVIAETFSRAIKRKVSVIASPFWNDRAVCDESIYKERLYGKKYFLFFGRLVADKGILIIAKCLEQFLHDHPEYHFVCCGIGAVIDDKDPVEILKKAAGSHQERFIYMKPLPHETLYPVVSHAEFVIFPSLIDNLSNACIEAMYFGRVVIGTEGTSYEQLIEDGRSGLLCMPGDAGDLLEKMDRAADMDGQEKEAMGRRAKEKIAELAPEHTVGKLLRYYRYVIDNATGKKDPSARDGMASWWG